MSRRDEQTFTQSVSLSSLRGRVKRCSRTTLALVLAGPSALLGAAGCGPEPVTVDLVFPALSYLALTDRAEVLAFRRSGSTRCAQLSTSARAGMLPGNHVAKTGSYPICDLENGGATLDLDQGDYDLVGVGRGTDRVVLVVGCARAQVGEGGGRIALLMANLSSEGERRIQPEPDCSGVDEYCSNECE